jgi:protein-disulfide isomerase
VASRDDNKSAGSNIWPWALATGLAIGFIVGREVGSRTGNPNVGSAAPAAVAPAPVAAAAVAGVIPAKVYASEADFPGAWYKAADLATVPGLSMDGMTDVQKATVMQALNERTCDCGCSFGTLANCVKRDSACPRSPKIAKEAFALAKQGKPLADILGYVDRENPKPGAARPPAAAAPGPGPKKVSIPAHSPRKGPKNAKVTIVEFSDFQCPFCSRVVPTLHEIHEKYPNDVAVVFVNQPLSFHDKARPAAKAFLAAHKQGKAWEMHDKLFENQQALTPENFELWAKEMGLDAGKFTKDMTDPATEQAVADDQALANSVGATGTPTFFVNGRQLTGAKPFDDFKRVIDEEIVKADELLKKGTKPEKLYETLMEMAANAPKPTIEVGNAPTKGPKSAPVTVVIFSDFECPFCSKAVPVLKEIEDAYKDEVRIAFKHLPLSFHANAHVAAEASMAANEQGKFWEMHDKLFENQKALDRPSLEKYAQELGLDVAKFKAALDSGKYKQHVDDDAKMAAGVGATGTPTFYVNGDQLVGAKPFADFKTKIDAALAEKKK